MNLFRISLVAVAFTLAACGATTTETEGELPTDLAELKKLRGQVEDDIKASQKRLDEITGKIEEIEPLRERPKRLVTTQQVEIGEFRKFARIQGAVESKDLLTVSTEIPGRLTAVKVEEGYPVKRGQLILWICTCT